MRTALLCLTTLLLTATVCQVNSEVPCRCMKTSDTVLQVLRIKDYKVQKAGHCPIDAVEFLTVRKITVCSDPKKPWVKKAMAAVDASRKTIPTTAVPTTTTFRPTQNTRGSGTGPLSEYREILEADDVIIYEPKANCCNVTAFVSTTIGDMKIHSDPQKPWVKKGQDYLEDTVHALETSTGSMKSQPTVTFCV